MIKECNNCAYRDRLRKQVPCKECSEIAKNAGKKYTKWERDFELKKASMPKQECFDRCSTGIQQKRENFDTFTQLIRNQFDHGSAKYASGKANKEFTDLICEAFPGDSGIDWVLGTCMKYFGRYKNFGREKDLLKVATYMYLLWLKGGFHFKEEHDEDVNR